MDTQHKEKVLSAIQNRILDDNNSIQSSSSESFVESVKPVLSLSSADQTWFELFSDCSEKEQMLKAASFIKKWLRYSEK